MQLRQYNELSRFEILFLRKRCCFQNVYIFCSVFLEPNFRIRCQSKDRKVSDLKLILHGCKPVLKKRSTAMAIIHLKKAMLHWVKEP